MMPHRTPRGKLSLPAAAICVAALLAAALARAQEGATVPDLKDLRLAGVNLAGADFGRNVPGEFNRDYTYPNQGEVDYYLSKGMNAFRVGFRWERLQHDAYGEFDPDEWARLNGFVTETTAKGAFVILDPHDYARYKGKVIGSEDMPNAVFADFWSRLAKLYADNPRVLFGLVNEPHGMPTEQWVEAANAGIAAIREAGARNIILVPGNAFSGAHAWQADWYGTPNAVAMLEIKDPINNYGIELHQYLDRDSSGRSDEAVSETIGSERLKGVTEWLREQGLRGFLGEFDCGDNPTGKAALDDMLNYMEANQDVWMGWTYWAGGPWWGPGRRKLDPVDGQDVPQMALLERHIPKWTGEQAEAGTP
jgi:endoglucanase